MSERKFDSRAVTSIMKTRSLVTVSVVGKRVALLVQGNGNIIDVKDKNGDLVASAANAELVLQKKIFNLKANSQVAMQNERNRGILKEAIAAEKAGNVDLAHDLFNDYLNKVQFSASILLPSTMADRISHGCEVVGTIERVETEKGSLLTFEAGTISVNAPETVSKTTFSIEDALGEDTEDEAIEPTPVPAGETPAQKKKRIAADLVRGVKAELIVGYTA